MNLGLIYALFAALCGYLAVRALMTGENSGGAFTSEDEDITRQKNPIQYWLGIAILVMGFAILGISASQKLLGWPH